MTLTQSYVKSTGSVPAGVTLGEFFSRTAERCGERTALVFRERSYTWAELKTAADYLALALLDLGITKGDAVGIVLPNHPEFAISYLAAARIGAVHVPISVLFRENEVSFLLNHSKAKAVICIDEFRGHSFASMIERMQAVAKLPLELNVIVKGRPRAGQRSFDELISKQAASGRDPGYIDREYLTQSGLRADDLVELIYTSGTTGDPKGCMHSHNTTCRSCLATIELGGLSQDDVWLMMAPLNHQLGLVLGSYTAVISGASTVLLETWNAGEALAEIERNRATILIGVPTMLIDMLSHPDFDRRDLSSVRLIYTAGAACPIEIARKVTTRFGATLVSAYGMSESNYMTITRLDDPLEIVTTTVGRPQHGGVEIKIVDGAGQIVPIGAEGEICGRGHDVCLGYFNNPELTAQTFDSEGWVHSGDLGVMDAQGNTRIVGRIKELIIRGGENIAPREIEEYLFELSNVQNCAVVGMPHPKLGEAICAFVIPFDPDEPLTREQVSEYLTGKVAKFKIPDRIEVVQQFPLTPSGKVLKYKLKQMITDKVAKEQGQG